MPNLTDAARELRLRATEAEKKLWFQLRHRQIEGFKFRRQQPIGKYIVDFVSFEKRLIVELDGGQHKAQRDEDRARDQFFQEQGFEVLRFWNTEVFENLGGVLEAIRGKLLSPSPNPSHQGRGELEEG
ncbi:MAG: endonuclease domain-containing protein [Deltaproteobacteria bacterium]|nr:endonuclease domain-containing protein [Deltaproteobacteria bacterium]